MGPTHPARTFRLSLALDRARCAPGAPLEATIVLRNATDEEVALVFPSSQRWDLAWTDAAGEERWRWSEGRAFAMMLDEASLAAGAAMEWRESVEAPREPGRWRLEATLAALGERPAAHAEVDVGG